LKALKALASASALAWAYGLGFALAYCLSCELSLHPPGIGSFFSWEVIGMISKLEMGPRPFECGFLRAAHSHDIDV
jgi:hypothetical protein